MRTPSMSCDKSADFSATVARFKAIADQKIASMRSSVSYNSFLEGATIEAFAKVEQSNYAGHARQLGKGALPN